MANRTRTPIVVRLTDQEKDELDATVATQIMGWHVARQGAHWALLNPAGQVVHRLPVARRGEPTGPDGSDGVDGSADGSDGAADRLASLGRMPSGDGDGDGAGHGHDGDGRADGDGRSGDGDGDGLTHVLPAVRVRLAPRTKRPPTARATASALNPPARLPDFTGHYGRYSREMSWAMTMVEAVTQAHRDRDRESPDEVLFRLEWLPGRWRATFLRPRPVSVEAETDAVAICRAALEVMGVR